MKHQLGKIQSWAGIFLSTLLTLAICVSHAQSATTSSRTWVASTGSDSNNCSRQSPCATFQGALRQTSPGGEVDAVDSADYGPVAIDFPVTIDGGGAGGRIGSVSQFTCLGDYFAVCVAADSAGPVVLRNLSINIPPGGPSLGTNGVVVGSTVFLENVSINGPTTGILALQGQVSLRNVTLTCLDWGIYSSALVNVDSSLIETNGTSGIYVTDNTVFLSNSTVLNRAFGTSSATVFDLGPGGQVVSFGNNRLFGVKPSSQIPLQ
jgi:hypothetical protein